MGYRVAVVGATGNVGRDILNILAWRQFPFDEVAAVASSRIRAIHARSHTSHWLASALPPLAFI